MANESLTPKAELIRSRVSRDWTPHSAIAEFVDNAFAPNKGGSREVYVEIERSYIEITDRGNGCDDINRLFCLGDSSSFSDRRDIGLYGVGATDACIWLGSKQIVSTVHDERLHTKTHTWDLNRPRWPQTYTGVGQPVGDGHPLAGGGTKIRIERLRKGRGMRLGKLSEELGRVFAPGLLKDLSIFVRRGPEDEWQPVPPFEGPELDQQHTIRWEGNVQGNEYHAEVGWMVSPKPDFNCVHLAFEHRLIEKTTDFFLDKRSGVVTGWVHLGGGWKYELEDHKGCVVRGPIRDELMRQIYEKCRGLIEEAQEQERDVGLSNVAAKINEKLGAALSSGTGARSEAGGMPPGHGTGDGNVNGRPGGGQASNPIQDPKGERGIRSRRATGISIGWFQDPEYRRLVQTREEAGHLRVLFNTDHPEVAKATAEPSNDFSIISTALSRVAHHMSEYREQRLRRAVPGFESPLGVSRVEKADALYAFLMRPLQFSKRGQVSA